VAVGGVKGALNKKTRMENSLGHDPNFHPAYLNSTKVESLKVEQNN